MKAFARHAHHWAALVLLGMEVVQFYAAGLLFYARPDVHAVNGWLMILVAVIAIVLSAIGHGASRVTAVTVMLAVCLVLQPVLVLVLYGVSIYLSALHPVNALIVVGLTLWVWMKGRSLVEVA